MFHSVTVSIAKVELNQGNNDIGIIHNVKPRINAGNLSCTKVNPESNNNCGNVDPTENLL